MTLKIEYENIFKQTLEKKFNLFLGAGFSLLSANEEGKSLPLASALKEELLCRFEKKDLQPLDLSRICTILQKTHKQDLLDFLKQRFSVSTFSPKYQVLTEFDIQRIITTNIDNLIEKIFSKSQYKCVYDITTTGAKYGFERESIDYVPLHGSISHNRPELLFGTTEIASAFRRDSDKWGILTRTLQENPTIFLGYSMADSGILEALDSETINGREHSDKWIVFRGDDSSPECSYYKALNFHLIHGDTESFLDYLISQKKEVISFPSNNDERVKKNARELFSDSIIPVKESVPVRSLSEFYSGAEPVWYDIFSGELHKQKYFYQIMNSIASGKNTVILGGPGCGKTTLLMQVAAAYSYSSYKLFPVSLTSEKSELIIRKLSGEKALIFIDDFTNDTEAVKILADAQNIQIVVSDRDFNYEISPYRVDDQRFKLIEITELDESDMQNIFEKIPPRVKTNSMNRPDMPTGVKASLLEFMEANIINESQLKSRFLNVIKQLSNQHLLSELFIMLCYVDFCRIQASFDMVMAFLRESIDSYEDVYEKIDQLRSLVSLDQDQPVNSSTQQQDFFRARSKYVSEIVIKSCPNKLLKTVLERFHNNIPSYRIHRFNTFKRKAYDADIIAKAFDNWQEGTNFYKEIYNKTDREAFYIKQQGALYLKRKHRYRDAFQWIDQALRESGNRIFSIKTSYAIILFDTNIDEENDQQIQKNLNNAMEILINCYNQDKRKAYHTEVFARYAIKYWEKYGNTTNKSEEYLKTANKWLGIELSRQTSGITRNLKEFEKLHSQIQPLLIQLT